MIRYKHCYTLPDALFSSPSLPHFLLRRRTLAPTMTSPTNTLHGMDKEKFADDADVIAVHDVHANDVHANDKEKEPESYYVRKLGFAGPWLQKLFSNGVEARGVERVPEDQRERKHIWNK